jgi:hypothetical protein
MLNCCCAFYHGGGKKDVYAETLINEVITSRPAANLRSCHSVGHRHDPVLRPSQVIPAYFRYHTHPVHADAYAYARVLRNCFN